MNCNHCDNCLSTETKKEIDFTEDARLVLNCVLVCNGWGGVGIVL